VVEPGVHPVAVELDLMQPVVASDGFFTGAASCGLIQVVFADEDFYAAAAVELVGLLVRERAMRASA